MFQDNRHLEMKQQLQVVFMIRMYVRVCVVRVCVCCACVCILWSFHISQCRVAKTLPHKITSISPYQQKSELYKENIQGIHYQKRRNQDQLQKDPPVKKTRNSNHKDQLQKKKPIKQAIITSNSTKTGINTCTTRRKLYLYCCSAGLQKNTLNNLHIFSNISPISRFYKKNIPGVLHRKDRIQILLQKDSILTNQKLESKRFNCTIILIKST